MNLAGETAIIHVTAPKKQMNFCIREIQILISSSVGREDKRLPMMHDLAFANPQWSTFDDDLALNYVVRHSYTDMKFIGIVPLSCNQYTNSLFNFCEGKNKKGIRAIVRSIGKRRIGILEVGTLIMSIAQWKYRLAWAKMELKHSASTPKRS
jgi:hypothetical protein